jgi:hypothetical protein
VPPSASMMPVGKKVPDSSRACVSRSAEEQPLGVALQVSEVCLSASLIEVAHDISVTLAQKGGFWP